MKNTFLKQKVVELEVERDRLKNINELMFQKIRLSKKVFLFSLFTYIVTLTLIALAIS